MSAWYNEIDPFAAHWLRNLIEAGHIAQGEVSEESVETVRPPGAIRQHYFAGIGGWDLALRLAGWPADRPVWTGSCPCQPFSVAGKQKGGDDPRHLWPAWFRLIREHHPDTIFGEQVSGAIGHGWLDLVFSDLEAEGYTCGAIILGAHSVGAPHRRQRLFWVADAVHTDRRVGVSRAQAGTREDGERWRRPSGGGADGRLGDSSLTGLEGRAGHGDGSGQPGRIGADAAGPVTETGASGWLEHATRDGRKQRRAEPGERGAVGGCGESGVDESKIIGRQGREPLHGEHDRSELADGRYDHWRDSYWLPCTDGKARLVPTQPALFPLASGLPGRVGRLRAYGNSIVPQVAATFVRAYLHD
jgi:DNA (cytosine-5)-methyltransferase 1